jgi:flagellar protein FlgJ
VLGINAIICSDFCRSCRIIPPTGYHLFTGPAHSDENPLQMEKPVQPSPVFLPQTGALSGPQTDRQAVLMQKAKDLEAAFLSEMLSYAGVDAPSGAFSGGVGEDQYASFLRDAQARAIVDHGGIGLAEKLFQSLARHDDATD